jgi:hypothetical protein
MSQDQAQEQTKAFEGLLSEVTAAIAGRPLDKELEQFLNTTFAPDGGSVRRIAAACHDGIAAGWMCKYEADGIRYGRVIKPRPELHGFSVDVVRMKDIAGPHHRHPNGEIDLIMPVTNTARFDQRGAGWLVYPADSAHRPTVSEGEALVLYLLPNGAIEFTQT